MQRSFEENEMSASASATASVTCPGTGKINTNVSMNSTHQYTIKNDGANPITVTVEAKLVDSQGNEASDSLANLPVPAKTTVTNNLNLSLLASYAAAATITVTATTTVKGDAAAAANKQCSFAVK